MKESMSINTKLLTKNKFSGLRPPKNKLKISVAIAMGTSLLLITIILIVGLFVPKSVLLKLSQNKQATGPASETQQALGGDSGGQKTSAQDQAQTTTSISADYVISVTSVSQANGVLAVGLRITNSSQIILQTSPFLQFDITSLSSGVVNKPFSPNGTAIYDGGPLAPGDANQGTLYFNSFGPSEQFEMRFYSGPALATFLPVPLIISSN